MRAAAALTALSCLLLVGCGGSDQSTSTEPGAGATLEELWRAAGRRRRGDSRHGEPRAGQRAGLVPRRRRRGRGRHAADRACLGRRRSRFGAVPRDGGEARAHRRSRRGRGGRDAHLRREPPRCRAPASTGCWPSRRAAPTKVQALGNVVVAKEDAAARRRGAGGRVARRRRSSSTGGTRRRSRREPRRTSRCFATPSPTRSTPRFLSSSRSRRRSSARAGRAGRSWTSSRRSRGASRARTSASSTSRCSRTTTRRRATTGGCRSGRCRPSPGRSSSAAREDRRAVRGHGLGERARAGRPGAAPERVVGRGLPRPSTRRRARSTTMFGTRAIGLSAEHGRERAPRCRRSRSAPPREAQSTPSSGSRRTRARSPSRESPCSASSRLSELVHAMSAAFVVP